MRTAAITVAAATLLGAVAADNWDPTTTTTSTKAEPTSSIDANWGQWETTTTTTTSKKADPTSTEQASWGEWSTTTTSKKADPTSSTEAWSEWSTTTTTSKKSDPTSSPSANWGEWESAKTTTSSIKTAPATSTATESWSNWDGETTTVKSTSTKWVTVTLYPSSDGVWSVWSSEPATATKTTDWQTATVTSTITKTSSKPVGGASTEFGWPAWDPKSMTNQCAMQVITSYGNPIWKPTPAIATSSSSTSSSEGWAVWSTTTSSEPNAVTSTSTNSWANWESRSTTSTTSSKPVVATSATESWGSWSTTASTTSSSSAKATPTAGAGWSQSNSGITSNGNKFGMTYSPYTSSGGCKDAGTVSQDIAALAAKGFTSVRVYSTDCSTLEYVGAAARASHIKIILGVFISETGINGAQPQVDAIAKWAQWDLVELIVVGNEAVFQGRCSASELAWFISDSKKTFVAAGYKGAVTTTDELSVWQSSGSQWCDVVDIVAANLYAFFNPNTRAEEAGAFIQSEINELAKICPGKDVYVMESGWPSAGNCNGVACPSPANQATAIRGISNAVGAKVVFFSYEDEAWKQPGQFGVEQHWGCASVFDNSNGWSGW